MSKAETTEKLPVHSSRRGMLAAISAAGAAGAATLLTSSARALQVIEDDPDGHVVAETVENYAALRTLATSQQVGEAVLVLGRETAGDGGAGMFFYSQTTGYAENGGTVIASTVSAGFWHRVGPERMLRISCW